MASTNQTWRTVALDGDYGLPGRRPRGEVDWTQHVHTADATGSSLHYLDYGDAGPDGLVFVLVHGLGGCWQHWMENIPELAEHGRVIAIDLPGFGRSKPLPGGYSIDAFTDAIAELGYGGLQGDTMVVVQNTPELHNVIVCTLCSCYPWPVLGLPPSWYKSPAYRARVVAEPRAVLREFGLELDPDVEVRVWDSTAEIRYLVIPERPAGTDGWTAEKLATLVTRDSMIGTGLALDPQSMGSAS